jgi:hypothetical protein
MEIINKNEVLMKTLRQLAKEIQENPNQVSELLTSFRTTSNEVRNFLLSMQNVPTYIVPALIETFCIKHRENDPKTIRDLMQSSIHVGSLFVIVEDDSDWSYVGISISGKPLCRPFNSDIVMELDPDKVIKYVF